MSVRNKITPYTINELLDIYDERQREYRDDELRIKIVSILNDYIATTWKPSYKPISERMYFSTEQQEVIKKGSHLLDAVFEDFAENDILISKAKFGLNGDQGLIYYISNKHGRV